VKALIIIPPSLFLDDYHVFPQLGPYYIKRFVEEHSRHTVDIVDYFPDDVSDYDVVGYSVTTPQFPAALTHAETVGKDSKDSFLVLGGPHCKHYGVQLKPWDFIVKGDGCQPFLNILNGNEPNNDPDDPDQLPHRDKSLRTYKYTLDGRPTTVVMTSRGCPNQCAFCEDAGVPVRYKSPAALDKELQECVDLGFTAIMFFDDLFCINLRRVQSLCDVIRQYDLKFRCFAHARTFNADIAATLAISGCVEIGYGAEHANQDILDRVNKRTTVEQNYKLIKIAHKYGIRVKAFLMLGLPGETSDTAAELEQFVLNSSVDDFDVSIYYPYKGTRIADHLTEYGLSLTEGVSLGYYKGRCGSTECITRTVEMSSKELLYWQQRIYAHNKRCNE
jgi:anaerobic magnesium-protoporphyrin IX monomethyl ester cyclase